MKTKLAIYLLIFVCTPLFSLNTEWVNGYIITQKNDTIHGQIGEYSNGKHHLNCYFRSTPENEIITYYPNELKEYGTERGLVYRPLTIRTNKMSGNYFAEYLFQGKTELYYIDFPTKSIQNYIFRRRDTDVSINIKNITSYDVEPIEIQRIKNTLKLFFQDSPETVKEIDKMICSRDGYIKLLTNYHHYTCEDEICIIYAEKKPARTHYLTIYSGVCYSP